MGKLSKGCDILFIINGDIENPIPMGSDLTYEQASYRAIAELLKDNLQKRTELKNALKGYTSTRDISEDYKDLDENNGIVHNCLVKDLVDKYPRYDWNLVDQSVKLRSTERFTYFGQDISNTTIRQINPKTKNEYKVIIINTLNPSQVENLYNYLYTQNALKVLSDNTKSIIENSDLKLIIEQIPQMKKSLEKDTKNIEGLENKEKLSKRDYSKLIDAKIKRASLEKFEQNTPNNAIELLYDYLDNNSKYRGLSYKKGLNTKSVTSEIVKVIDLIQGKNVKEAVYNDIFANEIVSRSKFIPTIKMSKISKSQLQEALEVKLEDLRNKRSTLKQGSEDFLLNVSLSKIISSFIDKPLKKPEDWNNVINLLINSSDDEFSYAIGEIDKDFIYFKNVPRVLQDAYPEITNDTISMFSPVEEYKGYNIYMDPNNGKYYFDQQIITTKSYSSKRYKSVDECKNKIDLDLKYKPLNYKPLIEFKLRGDKDVVWTPNRYVPGQVIKSIKMKFSPFLKLNKSEENLIYSSGENNSNTLEQFYKYIVDLIEPQYQESARKDLKKRIDSAEKAACFIYALNEMEGTDRKKISTETFQNLIDKFKRVQYEYFVIENVADRPIDVSGQFKQYSFYKQNENKDWEQYSKGVYKTLITPINPREVSNNLVTYDDKTGRPYPSIRLLKDLAEKINNKLGIEIHIETQSTLEDLFKEWNITIPSEVKGFVKDGEIYINSSVATSDDLMHEFTHIMLGVLKARNFDNYQKLVELVAESPKGNRLKKLKKKTYQNLSDTDLNEEVFVELFARHLSGERIDSFLDGTLRSVRKAVDKEMGSIFGAQKLTEDFYNATIDNVFSQFGYDLSLLLQEGNGLELGQSKKYVSAGAWIEDQIAKYKDSSESKQPIGIEEKCD